MATLVAGGTGFVGINLVKALAERGQEVISFDIRPADELDRKYVAPWQDRVTFIHGDVRNKAGLQQSVRGRQVTDIVNGVIDNSHTPSNAGLRSMLETTVMGKVNLMELAGEIGVRRFLWISSVNVYGYWPRTKETALEDDPPSPSFTEAVVNYLGESALRRYADLNGYEAVNVRINSTYGPMEKSAASRTSMSLLQEWTGNIVRGEPIKIDEKALDQGRQYGYIKDVVDGTCAVLEAPSLPHDTYNLSSSKWVTVGETVTALRKLRPSLKVVNNPGKPITRFIPRSQSPIMDLGRIKEDLGFTPRYDLLSGLKDYLEWRETFPYLDYGPGS